MKNHPWLWALGAPILFILALWRSLAGLYVARKLRVTVTPVGMTGILGFMMFALSVLAIVPVALSALWAPRRVKRRLGWLFGAAGVSGMLMWAQLSYLLLAACVCLLIAAAGLVRPKATEKNAGLVI